MSWLHLYAAVQIFIPQLRTVDRGCQPAPGLPCALFHRRVKATKQSSGEMRRERAKVCLLKKGLVPRTLRSTKSAFTRVFDALW
jgi:hypothetical protein